MTFTEEQVAAIVVEVIRRLRLLENSQGQGVPVFERSSNTAELTLTEKLVTTRTIENRLTGLKRLLIQRGAVVTPAVKDELKKHQIELVRQ
jgi:hypothetical protein